MSVCVPSLEPVPIPIHVHIRIHIRIHIGIITFYLNFYFSLFDLISLPFSIRVASEVYYPTHSVCYGLLQLCLLEGRKSLHRPSVSAGQNAKFKVYLY